MTNEALPSDEYSEEKISYEELEENYLKLYTAYNNSNAEVKRLREALMEIADENMIGFAMNIAREALKGCAE